MDLVIDGIVGVFKLIFKVNGLWIIFFSGRYC